MFSPAYILLASLAARSVLGHGVITAVTGSNGVNGAAFGVDPSTPRDGTKRNPFQQDSSIIRDNEVQSGKADACGRTLQGGANDIAAGMQQAAAAGLPAAAADGTVTMTLHQVNGDGAGPYTCQVSADGTGQNFQAMTVTQQVPGKNSRSNAKAEDFTLAAQMPAGATCTGGPQQNACIVRCRNDARAGPFGGCVAVTNAQGAGAAAGGNATAAAGTAAQGTAAGTAAQGTAAQGTAAQGTAAQGTAAQGTAAQGTAAQGTAAQGTAAQGTAAQGTAAQGTAAQGTAAQGTAAQGTAAQGTAQGTAAQGVAQGTAAQGTAAQGTAAQGTAAKGTAAQGTAAKGTAAGTQQVSQSEADAALAADVDRREDVSEEDAEAALADDLERRQDEPSEEDAEAALAQDLERRDFVEKRMLKTRIVGTQKMGRWI